MPDKAFQERVYRIRTGTTWIPAGVVVPSKQRRRIWMLELDRFITYLRGPLMLSSGFLLGALATRYWDNLMAWFAPFLALFHG
jgi:hypothetical protein